MAVTLIEFEGLTARVDRVAFLPHGEVPEGHYAYVYFITILNNSAQSVTIKGRKWIVTDAKGERIVVEADGVVGKFPCLAPGEEFSYNSHHVIKSDSSAEGSYIGLTDNGIAVVVRIPRFEMKVPRS